MSEVQPFLDSTGVIGDARRSPRPAWTATAICSFGVCCPRSCSKTFEGSSSGCCARLRLDSGRRAARRPHSQPRRVRRRAGAGLHGRLQPAVSGARFSRHPAPRGTDGDDAAIARRAGDAASARYRADHVPETHGAHDARAPGLRASAGGRRHGHRVDPAQRPAGRDGRTSGRGGVAPPRRVRLRALAGCGRHGHHRSPRRRLEGRSFPAGRRAAFSQHDGASGVRPRPATGFAFPSTCGFSAAPIRLWPAAWSRTTGRSTGRKSTRAGSPANTSISGSDWDLTVVDFDGQYNEKRDAMAFELAARGDETARAALLRIVARNPDPAEQERAAAALASLDARSS